MFFRKLDFCVFPKQLLAFIFGTAPLFLARKFHEPLLQSETKIFKQKRFHKKLVQSQREKKTREFLQLNRQQIQQLLAIVTLF